MNRSAWLVVIVVALAGCPHQRQDHPATKRDAATQIADAAPGDAATSAVVLPPAPPLPKPPAGLPALPSSAALDAVTPDQIALGELLFWDGRLATDGKTSCASCHDPAHGYSGGVDKTAAGEPNLRRTQSLANLAWVRDFAWDGRFTSLDQLMTAHVKGQLGQDLDAGMKPLETLPVYAAHLARVTTGSSTGETALRSLEAFVLTRYDGDSPWDRLEPSARAPKPGAIRDPIVAGYVVFTGKGQCAVCHTPPLYTDFGYHAVLPPTSDVGRGKIDPKAPNAFATPSLRGAASRLALFHAGSATTLDQAIDAHLGGADPALAKLALAPADRANLLAFVRALTADRPPPPKPVLP